MSLTIEDLKRVQEIYVHGNCPDGRASAMVLREAFHYLWLEGLIAAKPSIEFIMHGSTRHAAATSRTFSSVPGLFCDIAPMAGNAPHADCNTIVLDHHVSAAARVKEYPLGIYDSEPGVSGAVLAWREVWLLVFQHSRKMQEMATSYAAQVETFVRTIGARDTWDKRDPITFEHGQWASKFVMTMSEDECTCRAPFLSKDEWVFGAQLFHEHLRIVKEAIDGVHWVMFEPPADPVALAIFQDNANGFRLTSDVADSLRETRARVPNRVEKHLIVVGFFLTVEHNEPVWNISLRSDTLDVSDLAKRWGGGGHKAAAGITVRMKDEQKTAGRSDKFAPIEHITYFVKTWLHGQVHKRTPNEA